MKSLQGQLILRLLLGGALLLGMTGAALDWRLRSALTAEFDAALHTTAEALSALTEQKNGRLKMELSEEGAARLAQLQAGVSFRLQTPDGREVAQFNQRDGAALPAEVTPNQGCSDASLADGRAFRVIALRFTPQIEDEESAPPGSRIEAVLIVGRDRAPLDRTLTAVRLTLLLAGALALGALTLLVQWGVRTGLAPVKRIGAEVAAVDAASLDQRLAVDALPAELQPIAARVNDLLARLGLAFARERRFTANVAHELRTPLAELRALAEVNLTTPATADDRTEGWQDALATTLRMEALAVRLLELTRVDNATTALRRETINLAEAIDAAWRTCAARATERQISLRASLPGTLTFETDPVLLHVILRNVCANAAEHATANSAFRVESEDGPQSLTLHFENRADGLTEADVPLLFDRFWKKDAARADARNHGLGLALAADTAALLGGQLSARLLSDGNLLFTLQLPRVGSSSQPAS